MNLKNLDVHTCNYIVCSVSVYGLEVFVMPWVLSLYCLVSFFRFSCLVRIGSFVLVFLCIWLSLLHLLVCFLSHSVIVESYFQHFFVM